VFGIQIARERGVPDRQGASLLLARIGAVARLVGRKIWQPRETGWMFAVVTASIVGAVLFFGHRHHELWRDELHCFGVGRHAKGLWDVLTGVRRYDGHPFLWYYVLHLTSLINRSYVGLRVVTWGLAVGAGLLWLRYALLPRPIRILAVLSYYLAYEYGVICRSYTLGVFLLFLICALYRPLRINYVLLGVLLVLLAATSIYGVAMAIALALFFFTRGAVVDSASSEKRVSVPIAWAVGAAIFVLGTAVVCLTTRPPEDAYYRMGDVAPLTWKAFRDASTRYWTAMFPFKGLTEWSWVGGDYLGSKWPRTVSFVPWAGAAWFLGWLVALRRSPRAAATYAVGAFLFAVVNFAVYAGTWRHIGHYFVFLLACVWLFARDRAHGRPARLAYGMLALNLAVQVVTAVGAYKADYELSFSRAGEAVRFITDHHLENLPVLADLDAPTSPIAIMLDRPFQYAPTGQHLQAPVYHNRRVSTSNETLLQTARGLARDYGKDALVIVDASRGSLADVSSGATLLWASGPAIVYDEVFFLYRVKSK
jgi:hypothetical protein